jgi:hypothetical protein
MVYGFMKQSGGHLRIYSEFGHGTTIHLYLPRAEEEPGSPPDRNMPVAATKVADPGAIPCWWSTTTRRSGVSQRKR